ncbi:MAG: hypothetical protein E6Q98_23040 [Rhodospirillaceae bacterium]|nr:MAG: hypothetical protein E6Q98_23040 [Rhodospirillaceae bacterium]
MTSQIIDFKQPEMRHSFTGRVRNFNLPPTASNSMMPIYEAVTNALYAIQERFPDTWADDGIVSIEVLRRPIDEDRPGPRPKHGDVEGFVISDNGIGLTDPLFLHFQELDTEYRAAKKGRGIGRLSWLKVFRKNEVVSIFERGEQKVQRSFDFRLNNESPFDAYNEAVLPATTKTGTIVNLREFDDRFSAKAHVKPGDIRNSLLAHFISLFAQPKRLKINLIDEEGSTNLSDFFFDSIIGDKQPVEVAIDDSHKCFIMHLLLPKKLAPIGNSLIFCAADRSVVTNKIDDVIGLKSLPSEEHGSLIYIGLVSGPMFDEALNHERTGFDLGDIDFEEVTKLIVDTTKAFLDPYLKERRQRNREMLERVLQENPLYASGITNVEEYVEDMPLNWDETQLVQDVAIRRHRANKALYKQVEKLQVNSASMSDEQFAKHVHDLTAALGETEKSALAQYVVERRWVIEILKERRKIDKATSKHQPEDIVHEIFCPLGVTSDTLNYDDHNLWLIDDRLAYYTYITSDRQIRTFAKEQEPVTAEEELRREALKDMKLYGDGSEPDLAIFKRPMLFRRENTKDPVVIVEFKSPDKVTYSGAPGDNPVFQIRKYIESLQSKSCYTHDGERITDINDKTPFHCFLIAEPSDQLYELLKAHQIYKPTPDGNGRFAYFDDLNAYFEFIPYDQVLQNASLRNQAFFAKLKIEKLPSKSAAAAE